MTLDGARLGESLAAPAVRDRGRSHAPAVTPPVQTGALLRAISLDTAVLRRLRRPRRRARVHSVFARVINIEAGDGWLLTLAHRNSDDAPDTVVIDLDSWTGLGIAPGTDVFLSAGAIDLGSAARVVLEQARRWRCRLPRMAHDERMLRANLPLAFAHLERYGTGLGIGRTTRAAASGLEVTVATSFRAVAEALFLALARNDAPGARAHVDRLLGLGTGLTPSGDDVLIGLLAALHTTGDTPDRWRALGAHVAQRAGEATHVVSAAALRHAAAGRVRARIVGLCRALMHEPPDGALRALERVMGIGSGSGTEIAYGVLAGFRIHLQRDGQRGAPLTQRDAPPAQHGMPPVQRGTLPAQRGALPARRDAPPARRGTSTAQHRTAGIVHGR